MEHRADLARVLARSMPHGIGQLIVLQTNSFARAALARFFAPLYDRVHALDCSLAAEGALAASNWDWTDLIIAERLPDAVSICSEVSLSASKVATL